LEAICMTVTIHRVNRDDRLIYVDTEWIRFGRENWNPALSNEDFMGRSLWDFTVDPEMQHLWKLILKRVREKQSPVMLPYRCDSPGCRRYMKMGLIPFPDGDVEMMNRTIREESREPVALLDSGALRDGRDLTICSWCKRVRIFEGEAPQWVEVEEAVARLRLLDGESFPRLSHGTCHECHQRIIAELDRFTEGTQD
jgi:hypothetical protein